MITSLIHIQVMAHFIHATSIGLISTTLGQLPLPIEKRFTVSDKFQSVVCRSPHVSFAPYWTVDVNGTALTENEVSRDYGAIVQRDSDGEGHYISVLTIPAVNLTLNDSTITCLVNFTVVILQYHLIIGEYSLVPRLLGGGVQGYWHLLTTASSLSSKLRT